MEEPEVDLIRRCQAGDKEAFGAIVKRYAGAACGAASLLLGNYEEALEASQDAFVRAWRHIRRFDLKRDFHAWYFGILRNICVDRLRRRPKVRTVQLSDVHAQRSPESGPVLLAERSERHDRIWRAILELPESLREMIVMSHFQHMSYKQMADCLGIPIGTVMSRLYRARQALRRKLAPEQP